MVLDIATINGLSLTKIQLREIKGKGACIENFDRLIG